MPKKYKKPDSDQRAMIRRRGLDPDIYVVIRNLYTTLYLKDIRTGAVKIITKYN